MPVNINRVILTANLTKDPELRQTPSGTSVCKLRVACNTRRKDGSGQWVDKPNYFDVTIWGAQGENCANYLSKGRAVAIDGRLEWREWESQEGQKRQAVEIVAESVQFLGDGKNGGGQNSALSYAQGQAAPAENYAGATAPSGYGGAPSGGQYGDPAPVGPAGADDDIPF